jgi:3-oxoacyl-[acyl-carrier-protein] synthase-3
MGTATPDMPVAATGVYVATEIGATNAFAFDLQAACSSFCMECLLPQHVQSGKYKKVLLIGLIKCLLS